MNTKSNSEDPRCNNGTYCGTQDGRWVKLVKEYVKDLEFGEVTRTVHNGHVVQIQKMEKIRF